jgi:hypothetical protein
MATTTNNGWETPDDTDLVKDGALAMRTLGNSIDTSTGKGLLAWQSWAPTLSGGWLNGNGVWTTAKYCQIGKTVLVKGQFTIGTTTTKGTNLIVSLPVTAVTHTTIAEASGLVYWTPAGVGSWGVVYPNTTTTARFLSYTTNGTYLDSAQVTATVPGTWATTNTFSFSLTYEAA